MNRREFIKIATAAGLGTVAIGSAATWLRPTASAASTFPIKAGDVLARTPTYCEICFWQCAGWVHTKNGQPWKITGNEEDLHSSGRFCTRGTAGLGAYSDPDRLKKPLIRRTVDGKQVFEEASWDEALDFIAQKLAAIKKEYGGGSLAMFSHGNGAAHWKTLTKAYGSDCITAPSFAQCRGPRDIGFQLTYGEEVGSPERTDIENTRCLVLIGSHLGENLHNGQVQEMSKAQARGAELIVVDPRFSVAAGKAKHWLPIKPATDLALLLAWINVILEENLYDAAYVAQYTMGLEELREAVKANTPEWAYPITSIEPEVIRETARMMARNAPATLIHPGRHATWYGDDTQRSRAIAILNALLGSWGRKGGFYTMQKAAVPAYEHPPFPEPEWRLCDYMRQYYPFANSPIASAIRDATITPVAPGRDIKAWLVYGSNLMLALPEMDKTVKAIQQLDLLVVVDIMPAEICGYADVVLPESTYLERYDELRESTGRQPQIAVRVPALPTLYDTKPSEWIVKRLAEKMGLGHYFPWRDMEDYLDTRLKAAGLSLAEMKQAGVKTLPAAAPLYFSEGEEIAFATPSGKIEFYSSQLAEAGFDPIPRYTPHPEPPEGFYRLLQGRAPAHTFARTTNNPLLNELMPENELWVNPQIAKDWGIKTGQYIRLQNQDGKESTFAIKTRVTEKIRPDCVYMVHGFGHTDRRLNRAYGKGADDNELITNVSVDPIMGGTGRRNNFVTFLTDGAQTGEVA